MGQAFDVSMPEAVKGLEGAMLSFRKDTSTLEKAHDAAARTADLQVKASKISGMTFEDIVQLYKYGAAPAQMAHLSEEQLLAFGAISKKSNMGGDESGVAFRALAKNLITPTAGAQVAMRAAGIDFSKFQQTPDSLDTAGFVDTVAKKYGVALDVKAQASIDKLFHDKSVFADAAKFAPAMREVLGDVLGGDDAKSKTKIAGLANAYRDASMKGVDTNGLMASVIQGISKNPALANAIFGSKQGGRIFAALGDPDVLNHILDELKNQSQGFAGNVSEARMAGFDGALSRLDNSLKNVDTAIGRAWDGGGSGGLLTDVTSGLARLTQAFVEASPVVQRTVTAISAVGAVAGALKGFGVLKGGFGLNASAMALDEAAAHLMMVGGGGGPGGKGGGFIPAGKGAAGGEGALTTEQMLGGAIPGGVTLGAAALFFGGAALTAEVAKKAIIDAQQPGAGGLWAPATAATEASDRANLADLQAERDRLAAGVAKQKAEERSPGTSDAPTFNDRARIATLDAVIVRLSESLAGLYVSPDREAERGNAMGKWPKLEQFGPDMPSGMRTFYEARTKDDRLLPSAAGPVPVAIVSASHPAFHDATTHPENMPTRMFPAGVHPDFTLGNNSGGFGSPGMGVDDHFVPERGAARLMRHLDTTNGQSVESHVDDTELIALDAKLTEVAGHAQALGSMPISVRADTASIEAMISLLTRAISLKAQLGGGVGSGGGGSVGVSYPQTAPTGRMGPR